METVDEYSSVLAEIMCQTPAFLTGHKLTEMSKNIEFKAREVWYNRKLKKLNA